MNSGTPAGVDYAAVLADLEARKAQIDQAIAVIKAIMGMPAALAPSAVANGSATGPAAGPEIAPDTFFGMSIPEAAKKFLAMRKRVCTTPEIVEALTRGGQVNAASDRFSNTVGSVLGRAHDNDAGIVRIGRGTWGLAEWYPNKPRKTKAQATSSEPESAPDSPEESS